MSYEEEIRQITKKPPPINDNSDVDTETQPQTKLFNQQAFGPWSSLDPIVKRNMVRTNISGGSTRNRFTGSYPPAPTIAQGKTAITGGFEFTINLVTSRNVSGYNVYSSTVNNPAVAKLIRYLPQPPVSSRLNSIKFQETTAVSSFYWVASTNSAGKESTRILAAGNAAPIPNPTSPSPSGGGSGFGSGGGRGRGGVGGIKL